MQGDNETVDNIVAMLRRFAKGEELPTDEIPSFSSLADRIEAAHRREVAELRECLQEAINNECNYCRTVRSNGTYGKCEHLRADGECDHLRGVKCIVHKWRKALEGENDEGK